MGVYQTSLKDKVPEPPQLAYIDIMPRCLNTGNIKGKVPPKFDNFRYQTDKLGIYVYLI